MSHSDCIDRSTPLVISQLVSCALMISCFGCGDTKAKAALASTATDLLSVRIVKVETNGYTSQGVDDGVYLIANAQFDDVEGLLATSKGPWQVDRELDVSPPTTMTVSITLNDGRHIRFRLLGPKAILLEGDEQYLAALKTDDLERLLLRMCVLARREKGVRLEWHLNFPKSLGRNDKDTLAKACCRNLAEEANFAPPRVILLGEQ